MPIILIVLLSMFAGAGLLLAVLLLVEHRVMARPGARLAAARRMARDGEVQL